MKRNIGNDITFVEGLPPFEQGLRELDSRVNNIIVLDDLMGIAVDSPIISKLFTQRKRHRNASIILMLQNAFPKGKHNTIISRNAQYTALFRSPADRRQIGLIADRVFDQTKPLFMELYNKVTSVPYSYVLIDNKPDTSGDKQVIIDIFGDCRYFAGVNGKKTEDTIAATARGREETHVIIKGENVKPSNDVLRISDPNGPLVLNLTLTEFESVYNKFRYCETSYNPDPQWSLWRVIQLKDYI